MSVRSKDLLVVVPLVAAGLAGTLAAIGGRGAEEAFLHEQENPSRLSVRTWRGWFSCVRVPGDD